MKQTWGMAFNQLLEHEAGFTDDPRDPGNHMRDGRPGCTNLGVTQQAWEDYVGRPVTHDDMKQLTRESVEPFYKKKYWDAIRADDLPMGVDYMVFDVSVNSLFQVPFIKIASFSFNQPPPGRVLEPLGRVLS